MMRARIQKATLNILIYKYIRMLEREAKYCAAQVKELQFLRLKDLLCDAYRKHPFYKRRFEACGFNPFKMTDIDEFKKLPLLTKNEYRQFTDGFVQEHPALCNAWYQDGTSGSTGTPLKIYRTWGERAYMCAKWMRVLRLNGYNWRDVTFSLPSPHRLQRDSIVQKLGLFKRFSVPYTASVEEMVSGCLATRPSVVYANKSQLAMMALYCRNKGIQFKEPKLCVSAAETMDENSRLLITGLFGEGNLIQVYGAVEFNNLAWQEKGKDFYRISHTTNLLEVLDENLRPAQTGQCVVTDFFIKSFPLIRYNLGDRIDTEILEGEPVIRKIRGRQDDWIVFADGKKLPFHAFYEIMERREEVRQFRIIQETCELIRIQVVRDAASDPEGLKKILLADLEREVRSSGVKYQIEWMETIEPEPNGKLRMLISKVKQD